MKKREAKTVRSTLGLWEGEVAVIVVDIDRLVRNGTAIRQAELPNLTRHDGRRWRKIDALGESSCPLYIPGACCFTGQDAIR